MPANRLSAASGGGSAGYRATLERAAFFADLGRRVVAVSGTGTLRVVDGLASNDASAVGQGGGTYSFFLDRRGRVVVDLRVLPAPRFEEQAGDRAAAGGARSPRTLWLDAPSSGRAALEGHLKTYVPPILAVAQPASVAVHALIGPLATEALQGWEARSGVAFVRQPRELAALEATTAHVGPGAVLVVRREEIEGPGFDVYVDRADDLVDSDALRKRLQAAVAEVGGAIGTRSDWEILRVERGLPVLGSELGPERLAQEAGQDSRAISLTKGCFTGQEVVARIHYRGHVNRHLRGLRWPSAPGRHFVDPERSIGLGLRGASDPGGGKLVGLVTSTALSPRFGPIGLAYVRREVAPGDAVRSADEAGVELRVTELPFTLP